MTGETNRPGGFATQPDDWGIVIGRVFNAVALSLPLIGAYGIFAIGIVLIHRASRMLNLAHGAMAMVPAYLLYSTVGAGIPLAAAFPLAILSGGLLGFIVEKLFVGRLRSEGSTAQTVGTVAALGILVAVIARIYGTSSLTSVRVFPRGSVQVGLSSIQYSEFGLFAVMLAVAAGLFLLIQRTDLGLMMRGVAENRLAASLMGVNPQLITSFTWILGGALAALGGVLLASATTVLHPYTLALQVLPAFIAALIGGLGSLPGALIGAAIVGITQGLVPVLGPVGKLQGAPQLFLAILAILVMAARGRKLVSADSGGGDMRTSPAPATKPAKSKRSSESESADRTPGSLRRRVMTIALVVAFAAAFIDKIPTSVIGSANLAASYTLVAVSLVLLTGWVGQISLGHAALVGIGAYTTGHVVAGLDISFPLSLPLAALAAAAAAALLGGVAFRVRGLYLAVATLVFSWMSSEFLFRQDWFTKHGQIPNQILGLEGTLPQFDLTNRRVFYIVAWSVGALIILAVANLRDSKTGRAFFAVRGSEMAAASLGINITRYKLLAFACSGAIAGAAGNLIMTDARVVTADQFTFTVSLFFLSIAVVGGLKSLGGAIGSGLLFAGLTEVFFRVQFLGTFLELTSGLLLAITLLVYRGGLASIPKRVERITLPLTSRVRRLVEETRRLRGRKRFVKEVRGPRKPARPALLSRFRLPQRLRRKRTRESEPPLDLAAVLSQIAQDSAPANTVVSTNGHGDLAAARAKVAERKIDRDRHQLRTLIEARDVTVQFGGLKAVSNASLEVREGEIVGLIGPNGAGKTTLFNAIAGYNDPTSGSISLYGKDVTDLPVHRRAEVGVARTFQLIQLFSDLTVYQNLLVATHVHNPTGFLAHMAVSAKSTKFERSGRRRVEQILELLELEEFAQTPAGDLPFGTLRMIEVARALVTGFRVIMLDEPASGLDNNETDRLMEVLRFVRGLGVTMLLIEHDVRMVTAVSDYMYVLEQGIMIAEGTPQNVQRDPAVIAAYLGEPVKEPVG